MKSTTIYRAVLALAVLSAGHAWAADLSVQIKGVKSAQGHIVIDICTQKTFLGDQCPQTVRVPAQIGGVEAVFKDLPPGIYAMQAYHDEKDGGKMRTGLFGIPLDGTATSNDASGSFGPPTFEDAKFEVTGDATIVATMRY